MRRRAAALQRVTPIASLPAVSAKVARAGAQPGAGVLRLQRMVGNQVVQRRIGDLRDARAPIQRETLESRVTPEQVSAVEGGPVLKGRSVTYKEEKSKANTDLGTTASKVTIEYAVDDAGNVTVGALRPEYTVTLFTPVITSEEFVEKFGPVMETLWDKFDGNLQAFSESSGVRNFNYGPQTLRHEEMHVAVRQLALKDNLPEYLGFLKKTGALKGGAEKFLSMTDMFWRVAWDERAEAIIPHERMYFLDAMAMVAEYRSRASEG